LHQAKLPKQAKDFALLVAAIHLDKDDSRGVTVSDIKTLLGCKSIDAAEARKDRAVDEGLLVAHPTLKEGKQKMYFLSNYIHVVDERLKRKYEEAPISPHDITFAFIKMLSSRKCAYHHISLRTDLKYPQEDYERLNEKIWIEKSSKNKTKIFTFKLEDRRNCTLNISKNGTVMTSIECSTYPYKLHTYEGIAELFVSCGQIYGILQQEAHNRLNVVPHPIDWRIVQFDNDKTISIAELKKEYPKINWHSKAALTLRDTSAAFRMYVKEMPEQGCCLRAELIKSFKDSKTLSEKIKEIAKRDDVEYTPDDFLKDRLSERNNHEDNEDG
jgi:predicted adenine nucleotide alpha hydrolase (AANH) superfamily ATPase